MTGFLRRWRAEALCSDDVDTRLQGIKKLVQSHDPQAVTLLIEKLEDEEPEVRANAATALASIGSPQAIRPLVQLVLHEREATVLEQGTAALARINGQKRRPELVESLDNEDANVCLAAARALRKVCWNQLNPATKAQVAILQDNCEEAATFGRDAIPPLKKAMCTGTAHMCRQAADALGVIGSREALAALIDLMRNPDLDRGIRETAAHGIRRMCWEQVTDADLARAAILLGAWSDVTRIGSAAVEPLVEAMAAEDPDVRQASAKALGAIGTPDASGALAQTLADNSLEVEVRELATSLLASRTDTTSERGLVAALVDESWSVRKAAAAALAERGWFPEKKSERILYAIARGDWFVVKIAGSEAIQPLVDVLKFHAVGLDAARALISLGSRGRDALVSILSRSNESLPVREIVTMALAESGDARAVEPLRTMLKDQDFAVRQSAVWTLERLGWEPVSLVEKAVCAIVHGDWERVRQFGAPAIEPLLRLAADAMAPKETAFALEQILDACPAKISIDHLRKLTMLHDLRPTPVADERDGAEDSAPVEQIVDCSAIRRLAKNELARRGFMS
ncbi:MAG: HEAT repeat domain-containing protein [Phycisphaerae bacterium]